MRAAQFGDNPRQIHIELPEERGYYFFPNPFASIHQ